MSKIIHIDGIAAFLTACFFKLFITFLYITNNQHRYFSGCEWLFAWSELGFAVGWLWIFICGGDFGAVVCRFVFSRVEEGEKYR